MDIYLPDVVGGGYGEFWHSRCRYRVVKGGRASKKSCTTALWFIYHIMKYPLANGLVVRRYYNGHKDSTYAQLKWAICRLGVADLWHFSKSPLELVFLPTGQKILFRGLDDPQSITSITVEEGFLCWVWVEEAFQITNQGDFDKLDMSVRGRTAAGYFKQITITFNPWSENHWLKKRFFDREDPEILALTADYRCNEFLDEDDLALFSRMEREFPRRYAVEGLGQWGISEGLIFENWREFPFAIEEICRGHPQGKHIFGLDFGYTHDPSAFIAAFLTGRDLYIYDEHYEKAMLNRDIAVMLQRKGYAKERIIADAAEPKSIAELQREGIRRVTAAKKGPDSINFGIQRLQSRHILVHPHCRNAVMELSNYVWEKNHDGLNINRPVDKCNHLMDALRYAMEAEESSGISVFHPGRR